MTTTATVALIASLGWLFLNWRAFRANAGSAGWGRSTQVRVALIWVALIAGLTLILSEFQP